jgi:hypothetical protein
MAENEEIFTLLPLDLQHLSKGALRMLASDAGVELSLLEQIMLQEKDDPDTIRCLIRNPAVPDESFEAIIEGLSDELRLEISVRQKSLSLYEGQTSLSTEKASPRSADQADSPGGNNIQKRIHKMSIVERISCALKGPKEARSLLVRDPNREIALTVLKNPKLTDGEVEFYAASTNVSEDVQREIGKNREWCKKYNVIRSLVFNPKTPVGISVAKLPFIRDKDLQFLTKSKNVPSAVRSGAKRLIAKKKKKP